jgi:hypothetical protein
MVGCLLGGALMLAVLTAGDASTFRDKLALWAEHGISEESASGYVLREVGVRSVLFLLSCLGPLLIWRAGLWRRPGWDHGWKGVVSYGGMVLPFWVAHGILMKLLLWRWGRQIDGWLAEGISIVLAIVLGGAGGLVWGLLFAEDSMGEHPINTRQNDGRPVAL